MKLPGVISLRNDLPIWAMPNGGFLRLARCTVAKLTNMPCAVSGRNHTTFSSASIGPAWVLNIRLKLRGSPSSCLPQSGHWMVPSASSAPSCTLRSVSSRWRVWQLAHSTSGSAKFSRWPDASQTSVGPSSACSMPTTSSRSCTMWRHHCFLTFSFSSTPRGP